MRRLTWITSPPTLSAIQIILEAARMIRSERLTANLEGSFVVFLIGMRVNKH